MTTSIKNRKIEKIKSLPRGAVYFLSVTQFPIVGDNLSAANNVINSIVVEYQLMRRNLFLEVMIRQSCLYTGLLDIFVDNAVDWRPQQGLMVMPHKPGPRMPDRNDFEAIDPRLIHKHGVGGVMDLPEFIFHITAEDARENCYKLMQGHGALSMMLTTLKREVLHQKWNESFKKKVTDRSFRNMPLFIPIFGTESFLKASDDEISSWFDFFSLYIGESKEEQGVVIVSSEDIDNLIEQISANLPQLITTSEPEILRW